MLLGIIIVLILLGLVELFHIEVDSPGATGAELRAYLNGEHHKSRYARHLASAIEIEIENNNRQRELESEATQGAVNETWIDRGNKL